MKNKIENYLKFFIRYCQSYDGRIPRWISSLSNNYKRVPGTLLTIIIESTYGVELKKRRGVTNAGFAWRGAIRKAGAARARVSARRELYINRPSGMKKRVCMIIKWKKTSRDCIALYVHHEKKRDRILAGGAMDIPQDRERSNQCILNLDVNPISNLETRDSHFSR